MYSAKIIQKNIEKIEERTQTKLKRYPYAACEEWEKRIGPNPRQLSKDETAFVVNEQIMCALDFRYWTERYHTIDIDGDPKNGKQIVASNPELHPQLRKLLQAA